MNIELINLLNKHEQYRINGLNLIASENILSPLALNMLSSDLNGRYAADIYGGTMFIKEIVSLTEDYLKELFNVEYASPKPVSGTISVIAALHAFSRPREKVSILHFSNGGFPLNISGFDRIPVYLPFDEKIMNIDVEKASEILQREKPKLVYLGASRFLFPHPVKEISEIVHDYGGVVVYDGSHVLGLIAGKQFQDPLSEGADVLIGSTHKTFPGPQGGVILTNDYEKWEKIQETLSRPYMFVDNPHVARIAALGITAYEMLKFGRDYASQIVKNSKTLASELAKLDIGVKAKNLGFTKSHQILLNLDTNGQELKSLLEKYNIFVDAVGRIGVQEVTRRGMRESEMIIISKFIRDALNRLDANDIRVRISAFVNNYRTAKYCYGCYENELEKIPY